MISGIQTIIYSKNAQADRAFFKDVLGFPADAGADGWLTFTLPPSELACLPAQENDRHVMYFICDDLHGLIRQLAAHRVRCSPILEEPWGLRLDCSCQGAARLVSANKSSRPSSVQMTPPHASLSKRIRPPSIEEGVHHGRLIDEGTTQRVRSLVRGERESERRMPTSHRTRRLHSAEKQIFVL